MLMTQDETDGLVVVTGAGGFIGGHLVGELRRLGYARLRAVDIKPVDEWYQVFPGRGQPAAGSARPRRV